MVVASNRVWQDISSELNNRMSNNALHVFVYKGYHGIKEKLGFSPNKIPNVMPLENNIPSNLNDSDG